MYDVFILFFVFSSRRRHTRYWRDWSSDVCSSDLSLSHQLVSIREVLEQFANVYPTLPVNEQHFEYWREHAQSFESLAQRSEERRVGKECSVGGVAEH